MSDNDYEEVDIDGQRFKVADGVSRRDLLKTLAAGGLIGTAGAGATASSGDGRAMDLGGSPTGDLADNFQTSPYVGPSNISPDNPTDGDYWIRTDTGERVYYDEGDSSWTDPGLTTTSLNTGGSLIGRY